MLAIPHTIYYPNIYLLLGMFFLLKTNLIRKTLFFAGGIWTNKIKLNFKKKHWPSKHDDDINLVEFFFYTKQMNRFFFFVLLCYIFIYQVSHLTLKIYILIQHTQYNKCRFTLYPLICSHFIKIKIGFYVFVVFGFWRISN